MILNGSKLPVKTFQDYVNLYLGPGTQRVYEKLGDRWEVCISLAEQGQFQQVPGTVAPNRTCTASEDVHASVALQAAVTNAFCMPEACEGPCCCR